jgi:hypothetical protein
MVNKCKPQTHKERNNRESEVRETVDIYSCLKSKERKEFIDYGSECAREFIKATVEAEKAKATATATATEPST